MATIEFNRQLIIDLTVNNYFGSAPDYTDDQVDQFRDAWIDAMEGLGFEVGGTYDRDAFETGCEQSLRIAAASD